MIRQIRVHHCNDGGMLEIGVSDKTVIEFNGVKFALSSLLELRAHAESGHVLDTETVGPHVSFSVHACPEPDQRSESERSYLES